MMVIMTTHLPISMKKTPTRTTSLRLAEKTTQMNSKKMLYLKQVITVTLGNSPTLPNLQTTKTTRITRTIYQATIQTL